MTIFYMIIVWFPSTRHLKKKLSWLSPFIKVIRWPWFSFLKNLKISIFCPGPKLFGIKNKENLPDLELEIKRFLNFMTSLWSEAQLTYILIMPIFLGIFRAIGIWLHSRDFHTLTWAHCALQNMQFCCVSLTNSHYVLGLVLQICWKWQSQQMFFFY